MERVDWVLAFDLATRTGWAMGAPGDKAPISRAVTLKKPDDPIGTAEHNIGALFVDLCRERRPGIVLWEVPMTPEGWFDICKRLGRPQNGASLIIQNVISGVLRRECMRKGIPFVEMARRTILKHYTGHGSWSASKGAGDGREEGKKAVIRRAHILGHLPAISKDDDRADAIALWDYGCAVYGRFTPTGQPLFEQPRMVHQPKAAPSYQRSMLDE